MQPYKHELKINLSFYPKDFKFSTQVKRKAFEEGIVNTLKDYLLLSHLTNETVNAMEFDGEHIKKYGMRPRGELLRNIQNDYIYSVADFYDVKVEEEEENVQKKE
jgi:hypothetical protein